MRSLVKQLESIIPQVLNDAVQQQAQFKQLQPEDKDLPRQQDDISHHEYEVTPEWGKLLDDGMPTGYAESGLRILLGNGAVSKPDRHKLLLQHSGMVEVKQFMELGKTHLPILPQNILRNIVEELQIAEYHWPPYVYDDLHTVLINLRKPWQLPKDTARRFSLSNFDEEVPRRSSHFRIKSNAANDDENGESLLRLCNMCKVESNMYFVIIAKFSLQSKLGRSWEPDVNEIVSIIVEKRHYSEHQRLGNDLINLIIKATNAKATKRLPKLKRRDKVLAMSQRTEKRRCRANCNRQHKPTSSEKLKTSETNIVETSSTEEVTESYKTFQWLRNYPRNKLPVGINGYSFDKEDDKTTIFVDAEDKEDGVYEFFKREKNLTNPKEHIEVETCYLVEHDGNTNINLHEAVHDRLQPGSRLIAKSQCNTNDTDTNTYECAASTIGGFLRDENENIYAVSSIHQITHFEKFVAHCTNSENKLLAYNSNAIEFSSTYYENGNLKTIQLGRHAYGLMGNINNKGVDILVIHIDKETLANNPYSLHGDKSALFPSEVTELYGHAVMKRGAVTFDTYGVLSKKTTDKEAENGIWLYDLLLVYHRQLEVFNETNKLFSDAGDSGSFIYAAVEQNTTSKFNIETGIGILFGKIYSASKKQNLYVSTQLRNAVDAINNKFQMNIVESLPASEKINDSNRLPQSQTNDTITSCEVVSGRGASSNIEDSNGLPQSQTNATITSCEVDSGRGASSNIEDSNRLPQSQTNDTITRCEVVSGTGASSNIEVLNPQPPNEDITTDARTNFINRARRAIIKKYRSFRQRIRNSSSES